MLSAGWGPSCWCGRWGIAEALPLPLPQTLALNFFASGWSVPWASASPSPKTAVRTRYLSSCPTSRTPEVIQANTPRRLPLTPTLPALFC